ncbi:hypothetical protein ACOMHN_033121 [Nucella lapillus]
MAALPLVPLEELDNAWMIIHGEAPGDVQGIGERVEELCDYMHLSRRVYVHSTVIIKRLTLRSGRKHHHTVASHLGVRSRYPVTRETTPDPPGDVTHVTTSREQGRGERERENNQNRECGYDKI